MASYERKTGGLLRIICEDGSFRNQMIYNRIEKTVGKMKITDIYWLDINSDYIAKEKLNELIYDINKLLVENYAYMSQSQSISKYGTKTLLSSYIYCCSETDLMALKLGL